MTFELTPERLQSISVKVVSGYMTKQGSLTELIAKEAQELELNPEQIKRTIESSNTIAYLRQLEDSKDRTFEFPVAEYKDVMAKMVLPDSQAEALGQQPQVGSTTTEQAVTKSAEFQEWANTTEHEKLAMLAKETLRCKATLTKMASEGEIISLQLNDLASKVAKDPLAFEKIAHVASEEDSDRLRILCGIEKRASTAQIFNDRDLAAVMSLNSLYKEAKELVGKQKETEAFVVKAAEVLEKKAVLGLIGRAVGGLARAGVKTGVATTKGAFNTVKKVGGGKGPMAAIGGVATIAGGASIDHAGGTVWENLHK